MLRRNRRDIIATRETAPCCNPLIDDDYIPYASIQPLDNQLIPQQLILNDHTRTTLSGCVVRMPERFRDYVTWKVTHEEVSHYHLCVRDLADIHRLLVVWLSHIM